MTPRCLGPLRGTAIIQRAISTLAWSATVTLMSKCGSWRLLAALACPCAQLPLNQPQARPAPVQAFFRDPAGRARARKRDGV